MEEKFKAFLAVIGKHVSTLSVLPLYEEKLSLFLCRCDTSFDKKRGIKV